MLALVLLLPIAALASASVLALDTSPRPLRRAGASTWLVAAATLVLWCLASGFQLLALTRSFRWSVAVGLTVVLVVVVVRRRAAVHSSVDELRAGIVSELSSVGDAFLRHRWIALGFAAVGVHLGLRVVRALVTPSLGWDDFTYHLYRAGLWVQDGGIVLHPFPEAWTYYEFFPWGGDLVWAWALIWGFGDGLVPFAAAGIWGLCWLAGFALAGRLGQPPLSRFLVATTLVLLPSQLSQIHTAYVDNTLLFCVLAASLLLLELSSASEEEAGGGAARMPVAFLLGAACGLAVLVKLSALVMMLTGGVLVGWLGVRRRTFGTIVAFGLGSSVALPNLVFNWIHRGSPFYPFRVVPGLPYNESLIDTFQQFGSSDLPGLVFQALWGLVRNPVPLDPFLNIGWSGAVLCVLGCAGLWRLRRRASGLLYVVWAISGFLITASQLFSVDNSALLTHWGNVLGRFLVPSLAAIMIAAGSVDSRWLRWILPPLTILEYFLYGLWTWPPSILAPTLEVSGLVLVVALAIWLLRPRVSRRVLVAVAISGLVLVMAVTIRQHDRLRWSTYALLPWGGLDEFHPALPALAWPIWRHLEEVGPTTAAVTAGWDGHAGHNWFLSPLLGSRLQNRVVYVPITRDGSLVSYANRTEVSRVADRDAWLERLRALSPEWVVALGPPAVEYWWMRELPEIFEAPASPGPIGWTLARVDQQALADFLVTTE